MNAHGHRPRASTCAGKRGEMPACLCLYHPPAPGTERDGTELPRAHAELSRARVWKCLWLWTQEADHALCGFSAAKASVMAHPPHPQTPRLPSLGLKCVHAPFKAGGSGAGPQVSGCGNPRACAGEERRCSPAAPRGCRRRPICPHHFAQWLTRSKPEGDTANSGGSEAASSGHIGVRADPAPRGGPRAAGAWTSKPCSIATQTPGTTPGCTVTSTLGVPPGLAGWQTHGVLTHLLSSSYLDLEQREKR